MRSILLALAMSSTLVAPALAAPPDAQALVKKMKAALEPARPGVRRLTLTVTEALGSSQVTLGEARKQVQGAWRILLVGLAPGGAAGTAYLVQQGGPKSDVQWFYLPYLRRVREVESPEAYSAFLNSDFTYADMGFVSAGATYSVLGEGSQGGVKTYQLQGVPKESWYYSRWVTTLNAETGMPIVREIYDSGGELWKRQAWGEVTVIDGVAIATAISMEDIQAKSRSDIKVTGADFDTSPADGLFDPGQLPAASTAPVWAVVGK